MIMSLERLKTTHGVSLRSEAFDALSNEMKEKAIVSLASMGLVSLDTDLSSAKMIIRFSPEIALCQACAIFDILNRIEKLDGSLNLFIPKWTLELQIPLGGAKGLMQWELLIVRLFPWLSIREVTINVIANSADQKKSRGLPFRQRLKRFRG